MSENGLDTAYCKFLFNDGFINVLDVHGNLKIAIGIPEIDTTADENLCMIRIIGAYFI